MYDLHCDFDIEEHKKNFINYLEVIIDDKGTVMYAVPSHQQKLARISGKDMETLWEDYVKSGCKGDCMEYLCEITNCISVWMKSYVGKANEKQIQKLIELKQNEIYQGEI